MKIYKRNGIPEQIALSDIDSITFRDMPPPPMLVIHRNNGSNQLAVPLSEIDSIAYVTSDSVGIEACGGLSGITDISGNAYNVVQIGTQCWMKENLKTTRYRDGSEIPNVTGGSDWGNLITGAWCHYENDSSYNVIYGRLYNWHAAADPHGLCPEGWHVPSNDKWTILTDYLGGAGFAGNKMKATAGWMLNEGSTNESGFTALPGGSRGSYNGRFEGLGYSGLWWSSTEFAPYYASTRMLDYTLSNITRNDFHVKEYGFSVRCVKD